ncbi:AMP-binding protein, partial [Dyella mobilis]
LCVERSLAMVVGMLAILKAGAAYVPLDPVYSSDRLVQILRDAEPALLLSDAVGRRALGDTALACVPALHLDAEQFPWHERSEFNPDAGALKLNSQHLAYIIYTSGSTGTPKGVMVEHRQLVTSTWARSGVYRTDADTALLPLTSMAFDSSLAAIFGTLLFGGALHLLAQHSGTDPHYIHRYVKQAHITRVLCATSLARLLFSTKQSESSHGETAGLTDVIAGGEPCPEELGKYLTAKGICLYNEYGPSEATVWSSFYRYPAAGDAGKVVPIGRPIANTRIYVLDAHRQPVPRGVAGELYIGGAGV